MLKLQQKLQLGGQPANYLILSDLGNQQTISQDNSQGFSNTVDYNKIQAYTQRSEDPVHEYYNQFQIVLKENSSLSSEVHATWVALNSMLINGLKQDLSLLVKRTWIEWETMFSPDLGNLVNQISLPPNKTAKILDLQLQQTKALK